MFLRNYKVLKRRNNKSVLFPVQEYPLGDISSWLHGDHHVLAREGIRMGYGKPQWGTPYLPVFVISLGRRMRQSYKVTKLHQ